MGQKEKTKQTVFSAMRPTGRLHLGHWVGALENWIRLQETHDCLFCIVDWHAYMGEYAQSQDLPDYVHEMALDWLACGIDPEKAIVFVQSHVPEHLELHMILSCITPLGWLERNPTYKEQLREIKARDLQTYGFLGYPVLQAADILLYKAEAVPIGEDQLPHLELTREIARRFNHIYKKDFFPDCEPLLTPTPRLLGLDGRKMSKSFQNTIPLADTPEETAQKMGTMFTDPRRVRKSDPGHPEECNVFEYYGVFAPDRREEVRAWCTGAQKGCRECKALLAEAVNRRLAPLREKRRELENRPQMIRDILEDGRKRAARRARATMEQVRGILFS